MHAFCDNDWLGWRRHRIDCRFLHRRSLRRHPRGSRVKGVDERGCELFCTKHGAPLEGRVQPLECGTAVKDRRRMCRLNQSRGVVRGLWGRLLPVPWPAALFAPHRSPRLHKTAFLVRVQKKGEAPSARAGSRVLAAASHPAGAPCFLCRHTADAFAPIPSLDCRYADINAPGLRRGSLREMVHARLICVGSWQRYFFDFVPAMPSNFAALVCPWQLSRRYHAAFQDLCPPHHFCSSIGSASSP